jgi:hypothetical protein
VIDVGVGGEITLAEVKSVCDVSDAGGCTLAGLWVALRRVSCTMMRGSGEKESLVNLGWLRSIVNVNSKAAESELDIVEAHLSCVSALKHYYYLTCS